MTALFFPRAFALVTTLALTGCADGRIEGWLSLNPFPVEPASPAAIGTGASTKPLRKAQVDLVALLRAEKPESANLFPKQNVTLDDVIGAVDRSQDIRLRNNMVAAVIASSDANCTVYVQGLRSGQVVSRLTTDFVSGGLATAASLVTPPGTSRILAGVSALSTATGSSIDRNIFAQQGAEILADAIVQLRQQDRAKLEAAMHKPRYDDWPFGLALADVLNYHGDCSMLRGFAQLKSAVLAREATIQAVRAAAAAAYKANATPQVMNALISGALSDASASPPATSPAATAATAAAAADDALLSTGFVKLRRAARDCLTIEVITALAANQAPDAAKPSALNSGNCKVDGSWPSRYREVAEQLFLARKTDIVADQTALTQARGANAADSPAVAAADEKLRQQVASAATVFDTKAPDLDAAALKVRKEIVAFFDRGDGGRTKDQLTAALRGLYPVETSVGGDPAVLAAIDSMGKTTGTASATARGKEAFLDYLRLEAI